MPEAVTTLTATAQPVREALAEAPLTEATSALHALVERFSADPALRDEALLLNLQARELAAAERDPTRSRTEIIDNVDDDPKTGAEPVPDHRAASIDLRRQAQALLAQFVSRLALDNERALLERRAGRAELDQRLREQLQRQAPPRPVAFECTGLTKRYAGSNFRFGPLDLKLTAGEITGVVGQNGHGKTTLLRMVAGELKHDGGLLAYPMFEQGGPRIDWVRVKRALAYVPQELAPWHGLLADTLHFEAAMHGLRGEDNERAVRLIVERLDLTEHLGKPWSALAGGYKLRFALARALVTQPRVLVMDEPLANLDQKAKGLLLQDVRDLSRSYRRPIAVLMSSHDLHGLEQVCTQMVFLKNGQVRYVGDASGIAADGEAAQTHEFELGCDLELDALRQRLAGSAVLSLRQEGLDAVLVTSRSVDRAGMLRLLLDRGVDVRYFRDNSRSVRRLFD